MKNKNKFTLTTLITLYFLLLSSFLSPLPLYPASTNLLYAPNNSGVVGVWSLSSSDISGTTVYGKYGSDQLTAVGAPTATTGPSGRAGEGLVFNGSSQYLTQKVYAGKVGTVTASMAAGFGFINDSGQNFAPYVRVGGVSGYVLVAYDGSKYAGGYIGGIGTGEMYLDVINGATSNGNMETGDPPTGWDGGTKSSVADERTGGGGTKSMSIINSAYTAEVSQSKTLVLGGLYYGGGWVKRVTGTGLNGISILNAASSNVLFGSYSTSGTWENVYSYQTCTKSANVLNLLINGGSVGDESRFDDIFLRQVFTPTANGVYIHATPTGTTTGWAWQDAGFNANSITSYEIRRADFQITGAMTVGAWVKLPSASSMVINKDGGVGITRSVNLAAVTGVDKSNFRIWQSNGDVKKAECISDLQVDTWYFIVGVADGTYIRIYINGLQNCIPVTYDGTIMDIKDPFRIGYYPFWYSKGFIAHPFICNRAQSATEVLTRYRGQKRTFIDPSKKHYLN